MVQSLSSTGGPIMTEAQVMAYANPGCVLLAFDWADGEHHPDFLGFAIKRDPGYDRDALPNSCSTSSISCPSRRMPNRKQATGHLPTWSTIPRSLSAMRPEPSSV